MQDGTPENLDDFSFQLKAAVSLSQELGHDGVSISIPNELALDIIQKLLQFD